MSRIILLNGPKLCGKNIAVDQIRAGSLIEIMDRRCKDHLFTVTANLFRMSLEEFHEIYECRETKETPDRRFNISGAEFNRLGVHIQATDVDPDCVMPLSVREALIYTSEVVCKPAFGQDYFGIARAEAITGYELAIDDSCGFDDEIAPTLLKLGQENVLLIRIVGRGTFEGDSRSFISNGIVDNTVDIWNTTTEADFLYTISRTAWDFYRGKH